MIQVSCCAIFNSEGKLLIAEKIPGVFEFPGGKKHNNETLFDCAIREIEEELHLNIKPVLACKHAVNIETPKGEFELVLIVAKAEDCSKLKLTEHLSIQWISNHKGLAPLLSVHDSRLFELNKEAVEMFW